MRKVWKLSAVSMHKHIVELNISEIETDVDSLEQETFQTPGGAFDSVALQVFRLEDKDDIYKIVSNLFKNDFTFSSDAKRIYKQFFYEAKHQRPDFFV